MSMHRLALRPPSRAFATRQLSRTNYFIELEHEKSAHNYHPIPRVLNKGQGCYVWDVEGQVSVYFNHIYVLCPSYQAILSFFRNTLISSLLTQL
jgi:hypothetical protein